MNTESSVLKLIPDSLKPQLFKEVLEEIEKQKETQDKPELTEAEKEMIKRVLNHM